LFPATSGKRPGLRVSAGTPSPKDKGAEQLLPSVQVVGDLTVFDAGLDDSLEAFELSSDQFQGLLRGDIAAWMLFLAPQHREFMSRSFNGPARVSGPSGSGKTALLLHRAFYEASRSEDSSVLVICYNISLRHVLSSLLDRLCGSNHTLRTRIKVRHLDEIASEICGPSRIISQKEKDRFIAEGRRMEEPRRLRLRLQSNLDKFLEKEIRIWLKGNPDISPDAYRNLKFPINHVPLSTEERQEVVRVYENYERIKGIAMDWEDLRSRELFTLSTTSKRPFPRVTSILVDEYQDLSVAGLKLVMALAEPCSQNVFFCGDERQRIYCTSSSFRQLGIEIRGRAIVLNTNYRNTRQIFRVADHLTRSMSEEESDGTLRANDIRLPELNGPLPVLAGFPDRTDDEAEWITTQIQQLLDSGYLAGEIGVLAPTWVLQNGCAAALSRHNLPDFIFNGDSASRFFDEGSIKISTYHQSKGLEYKIVFCAGLSSSLFRNEFRYQDEEARSTLRSLLYMAVTRARDRLYLSFTGTPLRWLCTLDHSLVDLQEDAAISIVKAEDRLEEANKPKAPATQISLLDQV
jgi:superfamily I DNA/RNA helicase